MRERHQVTNLVSLLSRRASRETSRNAIEATRPGEGSELEESLTVVEERSVRL
jgi:hypothetical protein